MRFIVITALLGSSAAACPTLDDVNGAGVVMVDVEGTVMLHRQDGEGITVDVAYTDGFGAIESLTHGVYLNRRQDLEDGEIIEDGDVRIRYEGGITSLPVPSPNISFETASTLEIDEVQTEWQSKVTMGEIAPRTFGNCTIEAFPITFEMLGPLDVPQLETYLYFPSLGLAHLQSSGFGQVEFDTSLVSLEAAQ